VAWLGRCALLFVSIGFDVLVFWDIRNQRSDIRNRRSAWHGAAGAFGASSMIWVRSMGESCNPMLVLRKLAGVVTPDRGLPFADRFSSDIGYLLSDISEPHLTV
jgi:hypothetical protein